MNDFTANNSLVKFKSNKVNLHCYHCNSDTLHDNIITIDFHPQILFLVINRFQHNTVLKNTTPMTINKSIKLDDCSYKLIGYINHHGNSYTSGHYTAIVNCNDRWCLCNDLAVMDITMEYPAVSRETYVCCYVKSMGDFDGIITT